MTDVGPVIVAQSVSVVIAGVQVLAPVSLEVGAGRVLAVMGPSGSGKSTLLGCLSGVRVPTGGSVRLDGVDVGSLPVDTRARLRRERCGVVFQDADLLEELDIVSNVALPLIFQGVPRARARAAALAALESVGCSGLAHRRPEDVSGGEAQRAAVARAFVIEPHVVVADEPTASLDADNAAGVIDLIVAHARTSGAATVVATHDTSVASRCDDVLVLVRHAETPVGAEA